VIVAVFHNRVPQGLRVPVHRSWRDEDRSKADARVDFSFTFFAHPKSLMYKN
jgi:hypothetical protein